MTIKNMLCLGAIGSALLFTSCSNKSLEIAEELGKSYTYDGQTISVEGKMKTANMVWGTENRKTLNMNMWCTTAMDNTKMEQVTDIELNYGTGANSVLIDVPADAKSFSDSNVVLYDKNGTKLSLNDEVKVTGLVTYTAKGPKKETGSYSVIKIPNAKEAEKEDNNDYTYKITGVTIEKI